MNSDSRGNWCIHYCKRQDPTTWYVMKLQRSDGVLVSAKTYNEVFKFVKYHDAWEFAKNLITVEPEPKYDATVKRVCLARGSSFYLAGN
jgi:hypothetical protein